MTVEMTQDKTRDNIASNLINGIKSDYLSINDRAIHYGDGIFETILCSDAKLYYWPQHFRRLIESARKLHLSCAEDQLQEAQLEKQLKDDISLLLADKASEKNSSKSSSKSRHYAIKIILTRGAGERGYQYKSNLTVNRLVSLSAIDLAYSPLLNERLSAGELFLCEQQVSINESLAGLKHLNRLENVLARNEWQVKTTDNIIDGLMLNANGFVIEGTMSNVFAVKDNQLYTPAVVQSGVRGIMRDVVLAIASEQGFELKIKDMTLAELKAMDEIFITNSLIGMKLVNQLDDVLFNNCDTAEKIFNDMINTKERYVQPV